MSISPSRILVDDITLPSLSPTKGTSIISSCGIPFDSLNLLILTQFSNDDSVVMIARTSRVNTVGP